MGVVLDLFLNREQKITTMGFMTIIGGFILAMGITNANSLNFYALYLASYYRQFDDSITYEKIVVIGDIWQVGQLITTYFMPFFVKKIGAHKCIFIFTSIIVCISFTASWYHNIWLYYIIYGGLYSLCFGVMYIMPAYLAWEFFPTHGGKIGGLGMLGFSWSSLIFGPLTSSIVNPNNEEATIIVIENNTEQKYFAADVANNVPKMFYGIACTQLILCTLANLLIRNFPRSERERLAQKKFDMRNDVKDAASVLMSSERHSKDLEPLITAEEEQNAPFYSKIFLKKLCSRKFLPVFLAAFLGLQYPFYLTYNLKNIGTTVFNNDTFITTTAIIGSWISGVGKIGMGTIIDWLGPRGPYKGLLILTMVYCIILVVTIDKNKEYEFAIVAILSYIVFGSHFGFYSGYCQKAFGRDLGAKIFAFVMIAQASATIGGLSGGNWMQEQLGIYNIFPFFYFPVTALAFLIFCFIDFKDDTPPLRKSLASLYAGSEGIKASVSPKAEPEHAKRASIAKEDEDFQAYQEMD